MASQLKLLTIIEENPRIERPKLFKCFTDDVKLNRIRRLISIILEKDWVASYPEPGYVRTFPQVMERITYELTPSGREHLQVVREGHKSPKVVPLVTRKDRPNYIRIRKILNAPDYISNVELAQLWNEVTDFYLPYGNGPLQPIF
jgi:hypothetical protein